MVLPKSFFLKLATALENKTRTMVLQRLGAISAQSQIHVLFYPCKPNGLNDVASLAIAQFDAKFSAENGIAKI